MKKLSPIAYRSLFLKHVGHFLQKIASPGELKGNHAVAVSGGLDSMTLLWFASSLYREGKIGKVRAIFVNHNTRSGQARDAQLVKKFCHEEGLGFVELSIEGLSPFETNFESKARTARRNLCLGELREGELLWVGHHLDDSFEWNFMQRNRSTNPRSTIGIPVRNHQIIRPFNCVTRVQIKRLAKFEGIPYRDDPTNWDTRYDRNYVRHRIVPLIKARYPKYLKFYSHFANFSAMALKLSLIGRTSSSRLFVFEDGAALVGKLFSEIQIQELLHTYSNADRGKIVTSIQQMLRAIDIGKKGPFHFSGGMEAYYTPGLLMIYKKNLKNHDEAIARVLNSLSTNTLKTLPGYKKHELEEAWGHLLQSSDALLNLPGPVLVLESESICKTMNTSAEEPLFPRVSQICRERGLRMMTMRKCLDVWTQKKEKLPETLRIIPLFNLSNLFTSQD
jgi:tRNA(Ile)-lysidine synthase